MSAKFMSGTRLFAYECMMQQIPDMGRCSKEEKRLKAQYAGMLKEYMREYGYEPSQQKWTQKSYKKRNES